jgi:glucose/arabinose dehydrogenase
MMFPPTASNKATLPLLAAIIGLSACSGDSAASSAQADKRHAPEVAKARAELLQAQAAPSGAPNAEHQKPAKSDQTRAPAPKPLSSVRIETVASGLEQPWSVEALPDGRFVITEKAGNLRVVTKDGKLLPKVEGVPAVDNGGQGGLLDVAITQAADEFYLCLSYAQARQNNQNRSAVSCGRARGTDNLTLSDFKVVFEQQPGWDSSLHFGSRVVFAPDDLMYITLGERSLPATRGFSQDLTKTLGKVVRLKRDGSRPDGNPFADKGEVAAQIWSYGHRNVQAAALDSSSRLWTIEHGPRGGDELNLVRPGVNYGWPIISYGEEYSGDPIGQGITHKQGLEQPVYYWDPVIAPCGMVVYSGKLRAAWRGDVFVGGLIARALVHLHVQNDRVVSEERFMIGARVRDVTEGPDGAIYIVTDEANGRLLRIRPDA